MARALADHDRLLREVLERNSGYVFKTVGDEFCCAFNDPSEAVAAAVEVQRALRDRTWPADVGELRVRIAIHAGAATQRGGDYFGPTVNRVSRLLSIAHGGQIVVSAATAALLSNVPLGDIVLRELGLHRLKDLKQPETTYQVVADGLRTEFPALTSLDVHPNNLPSQMSSFVGREREIGRVRSRLAEYRVVTIAGPGGIGKTRLALQIAADLIEEFAEGVFFVALAPVASGNLVSHSLATALSVSELPNEPLETTLVRHIGGRRMLLVFDNAEHVLNETAALIKRTVSECPAVRCLITSREPLHLIGEDVERLSPLSTLEAPQLFLERARAVREHNFCFSIADSKQVSDICRRLDGIPLAIELAASRLSTMPLQRLAEKLSSRLLTNKDPTAEERHRTLRAAIEWSYRLLESSEQRVFLALSIFHGGCTLEALEDVAEGDVDDAVESLVDKSLVQVNLDDVNSLRYRLLQPIAEFALSELSESASRESLSQRHFRFYRSFASAAAQADRSRQPERFKGFALEIDNLRAALGWAIQNSPVEAAPLAVDLAAFWRARGLFTEGRGWFANLLRPPTDLAPQWRAHLLRQSAAFAVMQDDYEQSISLARDALRIFRDLNDEAGIGSALHTIAEVAHRQGRLDEAEHLYTDALGHLDAAGYLPGKTICLMNLGLLARQRANFTIAFEWLAKAAASAELLSDRSVWAQVRIEHAWVTLVAGEPDASERFFAEALEAKKSSGDLHGTCQARLGMATAALKASRPDAALLHYETALREAQELGAQIFVINAIHGIAAVCALKGDVEAAARCCGLAAVLIERTKCDPNPGLAYEIASHRIQAVLSEEQRAAAMTKGKVMRLEDVAAMASASSEISTIP
jgi:predicted ATPase